jgi:hypothetical protein
LSISVEVLTKAFLQTLSAITPGRESAIDATLSQFNRAAAHGSARLPDDEFGSILAANAANYAGFAGFTD